MSEFQEQIRATYGLILLIGLWLVLAPFFVWYTEITSALWNSLVTGTLIVLLSMTETMRPGSTPGGKWLALLLGFWLIASPFLLGFEDFLLPTLIHIGLGVMVAVLAVGILIAERQRL